MRTILNEREWREIKKLNVPEEHFPISQYGFWKNKLPFPFSKTNQEKNKTFLFVVYLKRTFKQAARKPSSGSDMEIFISCIIQDYLFWISEIHSSFLYYAH